jgi:nucleoside-diphosphate-sugar epimerase
MSESVSDQTVLIAGCGDLGTEVGLRLAALGHPVVGLRRSAHVLPPEIVGQSVDLSAEHPAIPANTHTVIVALAAGTPTEEGYRAAYVDGLTNLLDALDDAGVVPQRFLLVSSTAVYDVTDGSWVDENTPATSASPKDRILLEAEQLVAARVPHAVVFRLSRRFARVGQRLVTPRATPTASTAMMRPRQLCIWCEWMLRATPFFSASTTTRRPPTRCTPSLPTSSPQLRPPSPTQFRTAVATSACATTGCARRASNSPTPITARAIGP